MTTLSKIVEECRPLLLGTRIQNVYELLKGGNGPLEEIPLQGIYFKISPPFPKHPLCTWMHPKFPYFGPAYQELIHPSAPGEFCSTLRRFLKGAKIQGLNQCPGERLVRMELENSRQRKLYHYRLVIELIPHRTNIILVDKEDQILACWKERKEKKRKLAVGELYCPPPPRLFSPPLQPITSSTKEIWQNFAEEFAEYFTAEYRAKINSKLTKEWTKLRSLQTRLEKDLVATEKAELYKRYGELLKSHPQRNSKCEQIETINYFESTLPLISIPLDPRQTIQENSHRYFQKYKKLQSTKLHLKQRITEIHHQIEEIQQKQAALKHLTQFAELSQL
ncbi:MAG: hypothetical protein D6805_04495, partial [Planctomycetota bacterium]